MKTSSPPLLAFLISIMLAFPVVGIAATTNLIKDTTTNDLKAPPFLTEPGFYLPSGGTIGFRAGSTLNWATTANFTGDAAAFRAAIGVTNGVSSLSGTLGQISASASTGAVTVSFPGDVLIPTILTVPNTGLHLLDIDATHDLIIKPGSNITADRTLTITTGNADRTITLSGNPSLADWFNQDVKSTAAPLFLRVGTGTAPVAMGDFRGTMTAASGIAYGVRSSVTLTASANANSFFGLFVNPLVDKAGFNGLSSYAIFVSQDVTGTGTIDNAYGIYVGNVSGGTNTWSIWTDPGAGIASFGNTTDATTSTDGAFRIAGGLGVAKKLYVGTSINTGAPSGGTAAAWKLGTVASVSPTSPNRTIEVEINGTIYYLAAKTTNN